MTVSELIARLEDYRDDLGGDTEVRLMTQQHWPFENSIFGLVSGRGNQCRGRWRRRRRRKRPRLLHLRRNPAVLWIEAGLGVRLLKPKPVR